MDNANISIADNLLVVKIAGRVDATNCDEILDMICQHLNDDLNIQKINVDASELKYISSAGLRILLPLKQKVDEVFVTNASKDIYDTFKMTGFLNLFNVNLD